MHTGICTDMFTCVGMCMFHPCTKFHMPKSNGALALRKNNCNKHFVLFEICCNSGIQTPTFCSVDTHHVSLQCMDRLHVLVVQYYNYVKRSKTEASTISIFYNLQLVFRKQAINNQLNLSICCNLRSHSQVAPNKIIKLSKIKHTIYNEVVSKPLPTGVPGRPTPLSVGSDTHDAREESTQCCYKQCKMGMRRKWLARQWT